MNKKAAERRKRGNSLCKLWKVILKPLLHLHIKLKCFLCLAVLFCYCYFLIYRIYRCKN